jgi:hypothetical protein
VYLNDKVPVLLSYTCVPDCAYRLGAPDGNVPNVKVFLTIEYDEER